MRILYFIDSLMVGGAEMLLMAMLEAYSKESHQIHVAYFTEGPLHEQVNQLGIPVSRLSHKALRDPRAFSRSISLIRSFKPEVVHTHLFKSDFVGQICAALMRVPVRVSTIHNTDPWRKIRFNSTIMKWIISGCHKIIAVSPKVRDYALRWGRYPKDKMVVIENGIDMEKFNVETVQSLDKFQSWGVPQETRTVGIIGRLDPQKGHHIFLKAAKIIIQHIPDVRFVIIGDGPLCQELQTQTRELNLEDHVVFTGTVNMVPKALEALDIVVFSSLYEGLPVALLEAMAMRRPVVSTAVGGIPVVLTDGQDGFLVPPKNPDLLAGKILDLLENPELARRLGNSAYCKVHQKYDSKIMHQKILDLYQSIRVDREMMKGANK